MNNQHAICQDEPLRAFDFQPSGQQLKSSGNPVIPVYAADPDAHLFGDKYYIYATNAGIYPEKSVFEAGAAPEQGHGFAVWSSPDLRQWRSEGPILSFNDVSWARELANAWAPCAIERNGKYYFYFCADSRIGVAVSDSSAGPFVDAKGEPLIPYRDDLSAIDPMVFIDDDGQAYCYWGAVPGFWLEGKIKYLRMHLSVQKLAPDMTTFVGEEMPTIFTQRFKDDWHDLDHIEASHVIKRNGVYYIQYSQGNFGADDEARTYRVMYATAVTPLGPWHHASNNPMLATRREVSAVGPGHHGIIQIPGGDDWYCVYHTHKGDADRRVYIDSLRFDEKGQIEPVIPTLEGPQPQPIRLALKLQGFGPFAAGSNIGFELHSPTGEEFQRFELVSGQKKIGETTGNQTRWTFRNAPTGFHRIYARGTMQGGEVVTTSHYNIDVV